MRFVFNKSTALSDGMLVINNHHAQTERKRKFDCYPSSEEEIRVVKSRNEYPKKTKKTSLAFLQFASSKVKYNIIPNRNLNLKM